MKDFDSWNKVKKEIEAKETDRDFFFYEREVWWCSLGVNVGIETDGKTEDFKRPILILRVFNQEMIWILPMTSQGKKDRFHFETEWNNQKSYIVTSQIKTISVKRLLRKIRVVPEDEFEEIKKSVKSFI